MFNFDTCANYTDFVCIYSNPENCSKCVYLYISNAKSYGNRGGGGGSIGSDLGSSGSGVGSNGNGKGRSFFLLSMLQGGDPSSSSGRPKSSKVRSDFSILTFSMRYQNPIIGTIVTKESVLYLKH